jgi:hypothetical protein
LVSSTIRITPFYANYSLELYLYRKLAGLVSIYKKAKLEIDKIKKLYLQLLRDLVFFKAKIAKYYNDKYSNGL